ncbi:MAG: hypothetical protein ABEH38_05605 [Flavobacteriales bacterium]
MKYQVFILPFLFLVLPLKAQKDKKKGVIDKGKMGVKMEQARNKFAENDMRGALNTAREVLAMDEDHPKAHFLIARAQYKLGHYGLADDYSLKAAHGKEKIGAEYYLFRGKVHHRHARLDSAIKMFERFKKELEGKTLPKGRRMKASDVDHYIEQCKTARRLMNDSLPVDRTSMGRRINSRYDEYTPCMRSDGEKLFFTARRPDTKGGGVDKMGDHNYFEDIYYSEWDEEEEEWSRPDGVPGRINTAGYDAILSLSPNGERMYIYRNNPEHAGDIFRSELSDRTGKWRRPKLLPKPINSSFYEGSISTIKEEKKAYFISERKGGSGRGDIYVTTKKGYNEWSEPKNLGPKINTPRDEKFVHVRPDGSVLFFASNGHDGMGSYDIFKTEKLDSGWSEPENLGYPINTVNEESTFSFLPGEQLMYMAGRFKENQGARDLYKVDLGEMELYDKVEAKKEKGDSK